MNMKKIISLTLGTLLGVSLFTACGNEANTTQPEETGKITITATLFPQYDFARQIAGDKADVQMLLPRGVESHSFEPTPADIIKISKSDIFLYTGESMEPWAKKIIDGVDVSTVDIVDVSKNILLDSDDHVHEEEEEHLHEEEHTHAEGEAHEHIDVASHDGHSHGKDPHIWTSPTNAMVMCETITDALVKADPENAEYYQKNSETYRAKLAELDQDFRQVISSGARNKVIFGGRNPFHYFLKEYGLKYVSAYDSCSSETEPSVKVMADIIHVIEEEKIPVVYYEELVKPTIAESLSEETGADMLLFHSCHNVSKEEFENGVTYLSLMEQNLENLKVGLN